MKKKIRIFVDIHKYGTCDLKTPLEDGPDCYYLGDNIDMAHCHYTQIGHAYEELKVCRQKFGDRFVRGNHELNLIDAPDFLTVWNTVFCHGDQIFWGEEKATEWRHHTPGLSTPKRLVTEGTVDFLRHLAPRPGLDENQMLNVIRIATRYDRTRIVCAHRHPCVAYRYQIGNIEMICLPRGMSEIEVES